MTSSETADELVAQADAVLLDSDGPICSVFASYRAHDVAAEIMKRAAVKPSRVVYVSEVGRR